MKKDDPKRAAVAASRRRFLTRVGLGGLVASSGMVAIGSVRFCLPRAFYEPASVFKLGRPADFPPGTAVFLSQRRVHVFHDDQGVYVISAVCTHLGCLAARTDDGFACPCHGSKFGATGEVLGGPAPRGLPWLRVFLTADGYLAVDAGEAVKAGTRLRDV